MSIITRRLEEESACPVGMLQPNLQQPIGIGVRPLVMDVQRALVALQTTVGELGLPLLVLGGRFSCRITTAQYEQQQQQQQQLQQQKESETSSMSSSVCYGSLDFGEVAVSADHSQTFTITNTGDLDCPLQLSLDPPEASAYFHLHPILSSPSSSASASSSTASMSSMNMSGSGLMHLLMSPSRLAASMPPLPPPQTSTKTNKTSSQTQTQQPNSVSVMLRRDHPIMVVVWCCSDKDREFIGHVLVQPDMAGLKPIHVPLKASIRTLKLVVDLPMSERDRLCEEYWNRERRQRLRERRLKQLEEQMTAAAAASLSSSSSSSSSTSSSSAIRALDQQKQTDKERAEVRLRVEKELVERAAHSVDVGRVAIGQKSSVRRSLRNPAQKNVLAFTVSIQYPNTTQRPSDEQRQCWRVEPEQGRVLPGTSLDLVITYTSTDEDLHHWHHADILIHNKTQGTVDAVLHARGSVAFPRLSVTPIGGIGGAYQQQLHEITPTAASTSSSATPAVLNFGVRMINQIHWARLRMRNIGTGNIDFTLHFTETPPEDIVAATHAATTAAATTQRNAVTNTNTTNTNTNNINTPTSSPSPSPSPPASRPQSNASKRSSELEKEAPNNNNSNNNNSAVMAIALMIPSIYRSSVFFATSLEDRTIAVTRDTVYEGRAYDCWIGFMPRDQRFYRAVMTIRSTSGFKQTLSD